jgi:two-component system phosphate regulon response regulator OmpR
MENKRILIVDDDLRLRELLKKFLTQQGFKVTCVEDGSEMDLIMMQHEFDLLVLDIMLPGEDGLCLCKRVHSELPNVGIIMLTAKGDDDDKIFGLELGADDYVAKPFNPKELVARIHAILRRKQATPENASNKQVIFFGDFSLDLDLRRLQQKDSNQTLIDIELTTAEFMLLKVMAENSHRPLSRDQLMTLSKGRDHSAFDRSIDMMISRLRKLIEENPSKPNYIQTVWGHGYVFIPEGKKQA